MRHSTIFYRFLTVLLIAGTSLCFDSCVALYGIHQPRKYRTMFDPYQCRCTNAPGSVIVPNGGFATLGKDYRDSLKAQLPNHPRTKELSQPLQFWLYHRDTLIYATVNCYAPPSLFNLHWDIGKDKRLEIDKTQGPTCEQHTNLVSGWSGDIDAEYTAIIVYSRFMGRQNQRFLRAINGYLKQQQHPSLYRIYAQADSLFMD